MTDTIWVAEGDKLRFEKLRIDRIAEVRADQSQADVLKYLLDFHEKHKVKNE